MLDFVPLGSESLAESIDAWQAKAQPKAAIDYGLHMNVTRLDGNIRAEIPNLISIDVGNAFLSQWSVLIVVFGAVVGFVGSSLSLVLHRGIKL